MGAALTTPARRASSTKPARPTAESRSPARAPSAVRAHRESSALIGTSTRGAGRAPARTTHPARAPRSAPPAAPSFSATDLLAQVEVATAHPQRAGAAVTRQPQSADRCPPCPSSPHALGVLEPAPQAALGSTSSGARNRAADQNAGQPTADLFGGDRIRCDGRQARASVANPCATRQPATGPRTPWLRRIPSSSRSRRKPPVAVLVSSCRRLAASTSGTWQNRDMLAEPDPQDPSRAPSSTPR